MIASTKTIWEEIHILPPKERRVLELLYGDPPHTHSEIAHMVKISLPWVTRLERKAMRTISEALRKRKKTVDQIIERMKSNGTRKTAQA